MMNKSLNQISKKCLIKNSKKISQKISKISLNKNSKIFHIFFKVLLKNLSSSINLGFIIWHLPN